nr:immunoglobulin light chain junction region [Macaca mulatta]MOV78545.1 immunoglobulin light chain junction region [Macaca mulatta]MOV79221.1 immunoglobulin light chain junction region [Macaca mulatta]MOV79511.1 immunoglobulin light chain junction region [Macaca mulatta]MOV79893.1 immunoglobulin light chain junction region [Macaca mulatta]
CQQGYSYHPTF